MPPKEYDEALEVIDELSSDLNAMARDLKIRRQENELLERGRFGRSSERINPDQMALFQGKGNAPHFRDKDAKRSPDRKTESKKSGHCRQALPDAMPWEVIELNVSEADRCCSDCGKTMRLIGQDVAERGHIVPAKVIVNQYRIKKYGCPDRHGVKAAKAPEGLVAGSN